MKKITVIACLLALLTLSACGAQTLPADEGDVPPVEGISQTQEDGQTGTKVVYIPMWMQDYSVVYYDAHLNRTVESGGDLTIEAGQDGIKSTNSKESEWGYLRLTGGVIRILCGDDALDWETTCTIDGARVEIELKK